MFTGIVQCMGVVADVRVHAGGVRLRIESPDLAQHANAGDSICVSGVCLTVAALTPGQFEFDVVRETLDKTMLGRLRSGDPVNLEPSLRAGDRLDGHFVQGHVDGTATVQRIIATADEHVLWFRPQQHLLPYIIPKGSIAIDGVSLTVAAIDSELFSVALIPTTLERTTMARLQTGNTVNIESDMMVRTVVHYLQQLLGPAPVHEASLAEQALLKSSGTPINAALGNQFALGALGEVIFGSLQKQGVP